MDQNYSIKNQIRQERIDFLKSFFRNAAFGLILIFIAVGIFVASNIMNSRLQTTLGSKIDEVNELNHQLTVNLAQTQHVDSVAKYASLGVDLDRKERDDELMLEILKNYGNWSSNDDREAKMKEFSDKYRSGGTISGFNDTIFATALGTVFDMDYVSVGLSGANPGIQTVDDFKSYVVKVDNGTYYYNSLVTLTRELSTGKKTGQVLLTYAIEPDGKWLTGRYQEYIVK
jgi:hypothetical protein